jgi:hypothetical protein
MNGDQPIMWNLKEMVDFCSEFENIYIYGHGHDQDMLCKYLEMIKFRISGFIVSDNKFNDKNEAQGDIRCSDIKNKTNKDCIGIIVATWDLYFNEILKELLQVGLPINNVYFLSGYNKRTISHKMTPRPQDRMWIEVNLADHCNLNCQMCDHFAPLAKPTFMDIDVYRNDVHRLSELARGHIDIFKLQGGEPLLNDNTIEFIRIARENFPKAILFFFTDGLLLKRWESHPSGNFWKACHDYNVRIELTVYPVGINLSEIEELAKKYDVWLDAFTEVGHRKLDGVKRSVKHPFLLDGSAEKWQFISCYQFNESITLRNGKLYTCPMIPYIEHFNKYFNQNLKVTENDYIDIYKAKSYEELAEFVTHRTDFCNYCDVRNRRSYEWKQSKHTIDEYVDVEERK